MGWIDAHCHLSDSRLSPTLTDVVARSRAAGVERWILAGVDPEDWERQKQLRENLEGLRLCFGLHPWWVAESSDAAVDEALEILSAELALADACGELGIDKHPRRLKDSLERQTRAMRQQLRLAAGSFPLILHVVQAHAEVLALLERQPPKRGGMVHSFSGAVDDGRRYIELGLHLSLSGGALNNPDRLKKLSDLPVEKILVETDSPDQMPRGWEKSLNEPANLPRIAAELGPIWGLSAEQLLTQSSQSLRTMFRIQS